MKVRRYRDDTVDPAYYCRIGVNVCPRPWAPVLRAAESSAERCSSARRSTRTGSAGPLCPAGSATGRAIAWRAADSLSIRTFLDVALHEAPPAWSRTLLIDLGRRSGSGRRHAGGGAQWGSVHDAGRLNAASPRAVRVSDPARSVPSTGALERGTTRRRPKMKDGRHLAHTAEHSTCGRCRTRSTLVDTLVTAARSRRSAAGDRGGGGRSRASRLFGCAAIGANVSEPDGDTGIRRRRGTRCMPTGGGFARETAAAAAGRAPRVRDRPDAPRPSARPSQHPETAVQSISGCHAAPDRAASAYIHPD